MSCIRGSRLHAIKLACAVATVSFVNDTARAAPRVRKNYTALSAAEKAAFVDACIKLKAIDPGATNNGLLGWDDFVKMHANNLGSAHQGSAFLAWHREFLLRLEDALRATAPANAGVTIPYWDWTAAAGFPASLTAFIGGDGDPAGTQYKVTTGPFAHATGNWTINVPAGTPPELRRRFGFSVGTLPTAGQVTTALGLTIADTSPWSTTSNNSFRNVLEGWRPTSDAPGLHNRIHVWVGGSWTVSGSPVKGTMYPTSTAPNDPVFFLHHANVDRLWCKWQEAHPFEFHYLPSAGAGCFNFPVGAAAPLGHNACDVMSPFSPKRPVDLLNPKAMQVEYDDCVGPCVFGLDAAPQYQGMTLSQVMILDGL